MSGTAQARRQTGLASFNALPREEAHQRLMWCVGVPRWADEVVAGRPYAALPDVLATARSAAAELDDDELAAALASHPRIGEQARDAQHDASFSQREQSGVDRGDARVAAELAAGNAAYEERFDRVFLIRAAGRSAGEILAELRRRLGNDDDTERSETLEQLREIALLRLREVIG